MSTAFSRFNLPASVPNPAQAISTGLNLYVGNPPVVVADIADANINVANTTVPDELDTIVTYIDDRWFENSEADRRLVIDTFIQAILQPLPPPAPIPGGQVAPPAIVGLTYADTEPYMSRNAARVGHGPLDYIIGHTTDGNSVSWRPSVIVEAKKDLGGAADFGQWQLAAQLATARQLAWGTCRYTRGILTDGTNWRFYQLDTGAALASPRLERSPVYQADPTTADYPKIVRLIQKFVENYAANVNIWP